MSALGSERGAVQYPLIGYATEVGWQHVTEDEALRLRGGESGLAFKEVFISQIRNLNPEFMNEQLTIDLLRRLERIPASIEGNLVAWEYLKGLGTVFAPSEKRERNVRFIDTENLNNNIYQVTEEFSFTNGSKTIRPDIVFLINGIPLLFVETKSTRKIEGIAEALDQARRYHRECPELMAILQLFALTHLIQFHYSTTWNHSRKNLFNWKDDATGNFETLVKKFLDRERFVKVLTDYILFTRKDDELKKVVLKQHQVRAVEKVVERAASKKKRGLVWHTQGSGKTYSMIVTAQKILHDPAFDNPTVLMLVDRNELEAQLFGNLVSLGISNVAVADSKAELQDLLKSDKRGLIITMIHKFEGMPPNLSKRDNIVVLVDEAHRTTSGTLGNFLMGALPNASYIGFTGTPIDRTASGKGTFITFGIDDPPKGYLDKYSIAESIEDETTVPLRYALAPSDLRVDRATLEKEFLNLKETEGMSDVEELNKVLEKAVTLKNMLKNKERVGRVAEFAAKHFRENVEPMGYKAFLVAVDREACALYKEELDRQGIIPPEYSQVVYSRAANDTEQMAKYHLSEEEEKRIRKAFIKPDSSPRILIVTEKLLTGFDAPILYSMYLDKPMRDHVLLQTIARVNRPYEDKQARKKPSGFVLDFVGIFENLEKALAFDSADITGVVENIDRLKGDFSRLMEEARRDYLSILGEKRGDKAVEQLVTHFADPERRKEFYSFFQELEDIYDILSPDAFLRPFINEYNLLGQMYSTLKASYEPGVPIDREFTRKTARLVQEQTKAGQIVAPLEIHEINEKTLRLIEEKKSDDVKVISLRVNIFDEVRKRGTAEPYLFSIGEKAETIIARYQQRQIDTQNALEELKGLVNEILAARKEQNRMGMNPDVFTTYWLFRNENIGDAEKKAEQMMNVFTEFPHWKTSERYEIEVRRELYRILGDLEMAKRVSVAKKILQLLKESAS